MFKFITAPPKIQRSFQGGFEITFFVGEEQGENVQSLFENIKDLTHAWVMTAQIKRKPKSEIANDYLWVLCDAIADKVGGGLTKLDVYIKAVQDVGQFRIINIPKSQSEYVIDLWEKRGLGWPCRIIDEFKDETVDILCCYGSSCYNSKEESRLISYLVDEATELGIPTDPERKPIKRREG